MRPLQRIARKVGVTQTPPVARPRQQLLAPHVTKGTITQILNNAAAMVKISGAVEPVEVQVLTEAPVQEGDTVHILLQGTTKIVLGGATPRNVPPALPVIRKATGGTGINVSKPTPAGEIIISATGSSTTGASKVIGVKANYGGTGIYGLLPFPGDLSVYKGTIVLPTLSVPGNNAFYVTVELPEASWPDPPEVRVRLRVWGTTSGPDYGTHWCVVEVNCHPGSTAAGVHLLNGTPQYTFHTVYPSIHWKATGTTWFTQNTFPTTGAGAYLKITTAATISGLIEVELGTHGEYTTPTS
jgi:hypothetical protein